MRLTLAQSLAYSLDHQALSALCRSGEPEAEPVWAVLLTSDSDVEIILPARIYSNITGLFNQEHILLVGP